MTISRRILVVLLPVFGLALGLVVFLLLSAYERDQRATVSAHSREMAGHFAGRVESWFAREVAQAQTLAAQFETMAGLEDSAKAGMMRESLRWLMLSDSLLLSVYAEFEKNGYYGQPGIVDPLLHTSIEASVQDGRVVLERIDDAPMDTSDFEEFGYYLEPVQNNASVVTDPYMWKYDWASDSVLEVTLGIPIRRDGKPVGVLGVDILTSSLQDILSEIRPYGSGFGVLLSGGGLVAAHPDSTKLGLPGDSLLRDKPKLVAELAEGNAMAFSAFSSELGGEAYYQFVPVHIAGVAQPWVLAVVFPMDEVLAPVYRMRWLAAGALLGCWLLVGGLIVFLSRLIARPVVQCAEFADRIAHGDVSMDIQVSGSGETARLLEAQRGMVHSLRALSDDLATLTAAARSGDLRVRADTRRHRGSFASIVEGMNATLDAVANPLQVAVRYMGDIAKGELPPPLVENFAGDYDCLKMSVNSLVSSMRILQGELDGLARAAQAGDLSHRAQAERLTGGWRRLLTDVNDTVQTLVQPLNLASESMEAMACGMAPRRIEGDYPGDFRRIQESVNAMAQTMECLVGAMGELVRHAQAGDLSHRAQTDCFVGAWHDIVAGFNAAFAAVRGPISEAAAVLERVAERDLALRMVGDYQGDLASIKVSLNMALDNLEATLSQVSGVSSQVSDAAALISGGSQSLAQGSSEQAQAVEAVTNGLASMAGELRNSAQVSAEAAALARLSRQYADEGGTTLRRMHDAIQQIKVSSDESAKIVKTID